MSFLNIFKDKEEEYECETEQELTDQIRLDNQIKEIIKFEESKPNPKNMVETARWAREKRVNILGR